MHDPTKFPNIYFSKKKAQQNFCSFRFKVSIHKVFHQDRLFTRERLNQDISEIRNDTRQVKYFLDLLFMTNYLVYVLKLILRFIFYYF